MVAVKHYTGNGRLTVQIAVENGNLVDEMIDENQTLPDFLEPVKQMLLATGVETPWGELNIYFNVNGSFYRGDYDNPPESDEEREITRVTLGHSLGSEQPKYTETHIEDKNNLYRDIFDHFQNQIESQEYEEHEPDFDRD